MGSDPVVSKSSELLRLGLMPSMEELRTGKVRLSVYCLRRPECRNPCQDVLSVDISSLSALKVVAT